MPRVVVVVPVVELRGRGLAALALDDDAARGRDHDVASRATAGPAADTVEEAGVLATAAGPAVGGDVRGRLDGHVSDGEDAQATRATAAAAALLVARDDERRQGERRGLDRVTAAAATGAGPHPGQLAPDEDLLTGLTDQHVAQEVVLLELVEEGGGAAASALGSPTLRLCSGAVQAPGASVLTVKAHDLLAADHRGRVGGSDQVDDEVRDVVPVHPRVHHVLAEGAATAARSPAVVLARGVVAGLATLTAPTGRIEGATASTAARRGLVRQEASRTTRTAAGLAGRAALGLVGRVQRADALVLGTRDGQRAGDRHRARGEDGAGVGPLDDQLGAVGDDQVAHVDDAVDDRLARLGQPALTADDRVGRGVQDDGHAGIEVPVEVPAGSTRAAELERGPQLTRAPHRVRRPEGGLRVLNGAVHVTREGEALEELVPERGRRIDPATRGRVLRDRVRGDRRLHHGEVPVVQDGAVLREVSEALAHVDAQRRILGQDALRREPEHRTGLGAVGLQLHVRADLQPVAARGLVLDPELLVADVVRRRPDRLVDVDHDRDLRGLAAVQVQRNVRSIEELLGVERRRLRGRVPDEVRALRVVTADLDVGRAGLRGVVRDRAAAADSNLRGTRNGIQEQGQRVGRVGSREADGLALPDPVPCSRPHRQATRGGAEHVEQIAHPARPQPGVGGIGQRRTRRLEPDRALVRQQREGSRRRLPLHVSQVDRVQADAVDVDVTSERDVDRPVQLPDRALPHGDRRDLEQGTLRGRP